MYSSYVVDRTWYTPSGSLICVTFTCAILVLKLLNYGRIDGETLKSFVTHWSPQNWQEYEPLLTYCRDNGIQIIACGLPLEVLSLSIYLMCLNSILALGKIGVSIKDIGLVIVILCKIQKTRSKYVSY